MKKLSAVLMVVGCLALVGCMHTHTFDIQGHEVTQLRTWDIAGPSTWGLYESIDGKLVLHQQAAGSNVGQIAVGVGTGYAGERIGDGIKHQEPDSTNITNDLSSSSASEGGAALATGGAGGAAISNSTSRGGNAAAGAISGSSSSSRSSSSSNARATGGSPCRGRGCK